MQLTLNRIEYTYPGASTPALRKVNAVFPKGWTGIIGDNGCGKTTLARIAAGILQPDSGSVTPQLFSSYCNQDSTEVPVTLEDVALDWSRNGRSIRELLQIEDEWFWRYETLSGGQQRRIQIACALLAQPDVLVMDEPTNDLDEETRGLVQNALATFSGIGLLISHDRALLDALAEQSLVFEEGRTIIRPGGYTKASNQTTREREAALRERQEAMRTIRRLETEAQRRSEEASRQKAKRSRNKLAKKDSDGRERIGRAIVSGKDGVAGKLSATMDRRLKRADEKLEELRVEKRYDPRIGDWGVVAKGDSVAHLTAGVLRSGDFSLAVPELWVAPTDHVALTGRNGTGKSLVIHTILDSVSKGIQVAYVPQEVGKSERAAALAALRECDPQRCGLILSIVARLNSDPARLLDGDELSPGELRKLMLAEKLICEPNFLVLDEPTNHLDVGSIEALQTMVARFPGAVLLVSHDTALVEATCERRWRTVSDGHTWRVEQ